MAFLSCRAAKRTASFIPLLLAMVLLLALAQTAAAAPPEPTMDLEQLAAALESGPLSGHLLTTMSGTTPEAIPVQVESLVDYSWGTLILFEATGPQIDKIGGIAAGMSGSPIYVDDAGTEKLIGALSYGDWFTLGGMGLATPIEYMAAIEENYPVGALASLEAPRPPSAGTYALDEPVQTSGGVVRSVVVARSSQAAAKVEAASGQTVMAPLGILEIGGARPGSKAFARIAAKFEKTGLLVKAASGAGTWAGAPTPALEAGSPCAILFSQGAVWVGAAGTVTYVDADSAMLFGHPFEQLGAIDAVLTGGDVQGVWASSNTPYKLIAPRDVKGTCVQDRNWGVEAQLGRTPDLFPVTTTVDVTDRPATVTDDSAVDEWLVTSNQYPTLPAEIVSTVTFNALDQYAYPGSAETTTTVEVSDETGTYAVISNNLWSDPFDVSWQTGWDAETILWRLAANPDGVLRARVESVDVATSVSPVQRSARIASVSLPDGIRVGDTAVRIDYYRYGSNTMETIESTLVIPKGTPLYGVLTVEPATWESGLEEEGVGGGSTTDAGPPQTLAGLVDELNGLPRNSDLVISYRPGGGDADVAPGDAASIDTTVPTDSVFTTSFSAPTARVALRAQPGKVAYEGAVQVVGYVESPGDVSVDIYRQYAGSATAVKVVTTTAKSEGGTAIFSAIIPGLRKNATLIARTGPLDGMLPGSASATVKVVPRLWLSWTKHLVVHVRPGDADGTARLQKKRGGVWTDFKTVKVVDGEGVTSLPGGVHTLRVKFPSGELCAAGTSRAYTFTVR
jgi:hypothetical protein